MSKQNNYHHIPSKNRDLQNQKSQYISTTFSLTFAKNRNRE